MANTAINHDPAATFPGSSTDIAVVKWSGTGGKTLANSGVTIDSSNNVTVPGNITTTGYIHLTGDTKELRFYENGNFIAIKAPSLGADYTLTLPINDGATDEYLQTNGSGVLTWAAAGGTTVAGTTDNGILTFVNSGSTFAAESTLTYTGNYLYLQGAADDATSSGIHWGTSADTTLGTLTYDTLEGQFVLMVNNTVSVMTITNAEMKVKENTSMPSVTQGIAKAWCRWEMEGTHSLLDSYNMASVTDGGAVGDSDLLFDNDFANANYAIVFGAGVNLKLQGKTAVAGGLTVEAEFSGATTPNIDTDFNNLAVFGELA